MREMVSGCPHMEPEAHFTIQSAEEGERLDRVLTTHLSFGGRKLAQLLCDRGLVELDGKRAKKNFQVRAGNDVRVREHSFGRAQPAPHLPFVELHVDQHVVVVDKPAGIPSGAVLGSEAETMAGCLLHHYPEMATVGFGPMEPGLVHRLDNDTSGVLVAARTQNAFAALREAFEQNKVTKKYQALVPGQVLPDSGVRRSALRPAEGDSRRVIEGGSGRAFETRYRVIRRGGRFDLVEAVVHRAYRHQIRVHLAQLGAPLVGDERYGSSFLDELPARHALHASQIVAAAPGVPRFEAISELPADFLALL